MKNTNWLSNNILKLQLHSDLENIFAYILSQKGNIVMIRNRAVMISDYRGERRMYHNGIIVISTGKKKL